jgi:hypothetical protein
MLVRLPLAFILGLAIYMIAMMMTTYDGLGSLILQPIVGSILTAIALAGLCVVGSPLLIKHIWNRWQRGGWFVLLISVAGLAALVLSWEPYRVKVVVPETQTVVDTFHPTLSLAGWFCVMAGVAFCPKIGFRGDRRWM